MAWQKLDRSTFYGSIPHPRTWLHGTSIHLTRLTLVISLICQAGHLYATSDALFSPQKLKLTIQSSDPVLVIDIRPRLFYLFGHIPGAYNLWRPAYQANEGDYPYQGMRASRQKLAGQLGNLGVTPDTLIVLYDGHDGMDAARLWWLLKLYGHEPVAILDGGLEGWKAAGYITTLKPASSPTKSRYQFSGREHPEYLAELSQVKQADKDPDALIVDVRSQEEYSGKTRKSGAHRSGRIPGSVWFDYRNAVDDQGFLKADTLKQKLSGQGITSDKEIIVYCQSGARSAHTLFVLTQLLGFPRVRNYDGSWIEWSWNRDLPVKNDAEKSNTPDNKGKVME